MIEAKDYADAPKRAYTPNHTESQQKHNMNDKTALVLLASNPEIAQWAKNSALCNLRAELEQAIQTEAHRLSEALFENYSVELCENIARIWIIDQLGKQLKSLAEQLAVVAHQSGDSKANISKAVGITAQSCGDRFPQLAPVSNER